MASSRDKEQAPPHHHQPLLSSLVVRPSHNEAAAGGRAADFEPGELHRDHPPPYSRSDRYPDEPGYRIRAGSSSPVHRRDADHRFGSDYNYLSRSRGFGGGRDPGRYRHPSPPYGRGRVGGRPIGRAFDGHGFVSGLARGESNGRNNPNVRPREGDWFCPDPLCGNLNFARRDHCNSCNRSRNAPARSPRRAYPAPPPLHAPPRRYPGPPIDRSPERTLNGYRSPPRGLARDGPREYGSAALPPLRQESRFPDPHVRRERMDYIEDAYRGRNKFDRAPPPLDWDNRDRGRDAFPDERKGFERRPLSPPAPLLPSLPHHRNGRWARDVRERSRSPIRGGLPPKDYRRDTFVSRGRDDRRGMGRDRIGGMY
ncbi:uncharacterized protein LOC106772149 isoform X1 [Vigna radiata var. radiata]|uniref:Uncharacterized protein LOC106772149 isoform X1 n=1 Tax=Vigna radiata var. radiata TaxID=3916 RepID=A0A1S3V657_VIGRR|nr:uncharacterized protein LOC106772149 isoform X1 [Vigna radiata var. radiata]